MVFSHRLLLVIIIPLISFAQSPVIHPSLRLLSVYLSLSSAVLYHVPSFTSHLPFHFLFSVCFYVHPSSRYKSRRHDPHFQRWSGSNTYSYFMSCFATYQPSVLIDEFKLWLSPNEHIGMQSPIYALGICYPLFLLLGQVGKPFYYEYFTVL